MKTNITIVLHAIIDNVYLAKTISLLLMEINWTALKKVIWIIHIFKILLTNLTILNARTNILIAIHVIIISAFLVKMVILLLMEINRVVLKLAV